MAASRNAVRKSWRKSPSIPLYERGKGKNPSSLMRKRFHYAPSFVKGGLGRILPDY
jgi:hypothetical protein